MRLKLFFIMGFCCAFNSTMNAQSNPEDEVIRQCVVLGKLQTKIPIEIKQNAKDILILNEDVNFTFDRNLKIEDKTVSLVSLQGLESRKDEGYFIFRNLTIEEDKAVVDYSFVYQSNNNKISIPVKLTLKKNAGQWEIVNSIID